MTSVQYSYFKNIVYVLEKKFKRVETFRYLLTIVVNKAKNMNRTGTLEAIVIVALSLRADSRGVDDESQPRSGGVFYFYAAD